MKNFMTCYRVIIFSVIMLISVVGFNVNASNNSIIPHGQTNVYFNNVSNEIVVINNITQGFTVQVFDLTGIEIVNSEFDSGTTARLTASHLSRGVYLVRVSPVLNALSATYKVLIR